MKRFVFILVLLFSVVSCVDTTDDFYVSDEFVEVTSLMQKSPEEALQLLQQNPVPSHEYSILLAEALYKCYLPQHNFEEVKNAVEFFELEIEDFDTDNDNKFLIPNSSFLIYNCARAHYYHAVGLTERDDIVGACEHYLRALELMEKYSLKPSASHRLGVLDYDKARFMSLIYSRLGDLFYDEMSCDIAIVNYEKALGYAYIVNDNNSTSMILKKVGNAYHLSNELDSALYYYNKSLETNSYINNVLDIEKSIARILFAQGYRDSAYAVIKNNMGKLNDYPYKDVYYMTLGELYYMDKKYDSAIYYLRHSFESNLFLTKIASAKTMMSIYDSLGDGENKNYYSDIFLEYSKCKINKTVDVGKLHNVYEDYMKDGQSQGGKRPIVLISVVALTLFVLLLLFINIRYKRSYDVDMRQKDIAIVDIEAKLRYSENMLEKSKDQLKAKTQELKALKESIINNKDIISYRSTEICRYILYQIELLRKNKLKPNTLNPLTESDLNLLVDSANANLNMIVDRIHEYYGSFDELDLRCICLLLLRVDVTRIAYLLRRDYKTIWRRKEKIKKTIAYDDCYGLYRYVK